MIEREHGELEPRVHADLVEDVRQVVLDRVFAHRQPRGDLAIGFGRLHRGEMGSGSMAYDALREAMSWYEKAEAIRPAGNDDSILRWNTCARLIASHSHLTAPVETGYEPALDD